MVSHIVTKEDGKKFTIILNGNFKQIDKSFQAEVELLKALVVKHNNERNVEERAKLVEEIETILTPAKKVALLSNGNFETDSKGVLYLVGTNVPIPQFLSKKIMEYIKEDHPLEAIINFWKRLLLNPDTHIREQLFSFLENNGHPITTRGYFLAYKSVQVKRKFDKETGEEVVKVEYDEDSGEKIAEKYTHALTFTPHHSGAHGMAIKIGEPVTMPREECDNNPNNTCSSGLHVGNMKYVGDFGSGNKVVLECLISPTDVVSIPSDYNSTKMRTCKYFPIAISNGENESIYLESDFDEHTKQYLKEEFEAKKDNFAKMVDTLESELKMNQDVLDTLY